MELTTFRKFVEETNLVITPIMFDMLLFIQNAGITNYIRLERGLKLKRSTMQRRLKDLKELDLIAITKYGREKLIRIKKETTAK